MYNTSCFRSCVHTSLPLVPLRLPEVMDAPALLRRASPRLENLPVDTLIQIQKHLDARDIVALRKVCMSILLVFSEKAKLWRVSVLQRITRCHATSYCVAECAQTNVSAKWGIRTVVSVGAHVHQRDRACISSSLQNFITCPERCPSFFRNADP